jgi:hypothetical protein
MPRKPEESRPINHPTIGPELRSLTTAAIDCLRSALERKKGDRVAVDAAKWVLSEVANGAEGRQAGEERDQLDKTLHLLRGGRG